MSRTNLRLSPFRALVWKEWREQRFIWAALLALSLAVAAALRLAPSTGLRRELSEVLWLLIPFLWGSTATLLGANAFAGDRDTDNESFMGALPVSRRFRFGVKIVVVAALLWAAQGLTALCMPQTDWFSSDPFQAPPYFMSYTVVSFSLGMILLSLAAACIASWAGSTFATVIQTALFGPCLLLWMTFIGKLLYAVHRTGYASDAATRWGALAVVLVLAHVVMLAGAGWLWTAAGAGFFQHVRRAGAVLALFLLILLAPPAAIYAGKTVMAPIFPVGWNWTQIASSPAGRYALICFRWPEGPWNLSERVVLLDTESSRTVRFSRLHASSLVGQPWSADPDMRGIWSPDGLRFAFIISDQWTFPSGVLDGFPPWRTNDGKVCWAEIADGKVHNLRSVSEWYYNWRYNTWWWDDHTLAFHEGAGMVFQDIHTGEQHFCAHRGTRFVNESFDFFSARSSVTGIWFLSQGRELHGYRPDAAAASVVEIQMPPSVPQQAGVNFESTSPDGRWALLSIWNGGPNGQGWRQWMTCSLETGLTDEIGPLDGGPPGGDLCAWFTRDSKAVLLCDHRGIGRMDLGERRLEMLYTASPGSSLGISRMTGALSPSGKYVCVILRTPKSEGSVEESVVVDLAAKRAWPVWKVGDWRTTVNWLGDDQLIVCQEETRVEGRELVPAGHSLWVVSRDGTSKRKVLP